MQNGSVKTFTVVVILLFFTTNLSGSFLTIYFKEAGLSLAQIVELLLLTFLLIGLLPLVLLKTIKNFERVMTLGIFTSMLLFVILIYVKEPIIIGASYGISLATFWPSFNLLQFRIGETKGRARTLGMYSQIIPTLTNIGGPAIGGFVIEAFSFAALFTMCVALYLVCFVLSTRIKYQPETAKLTLPKTRLFSIFFASFTILGLTEAYWIPYPFFVKDVSGTILNMGLVQSASAVLISAMAFLVNWLSDIKRMRVQFALIGIGLSFAWYWTISYVSTMYEVVVLSLLTGLAGAFSLSWFANYADSFGKEQYASILVLMEMGLMIGRIANLAPTYIFSTTEDYAGYFRFAGTAMLTLIPLYAASKILSKKS